MNDAELVRATLRGELSAFEELVRALRAPLISAAYHLTGNAEDAQDLAQETLVEGYRRLPDLREGTKLRGWLFAILRNKCLRHLERRKGNLSLEECVELPAPPAPLDDGELLACLNRLPWADREVLAARYFQELSYEEIGTALDCSAHAARVRCARARERLRGIMLQAEEEQTRQLLQRAMSGVLLGTLSAPFVHRVLQEVQPIMHVPHMPPKTGGTTTPATAGAHTVGWKIAAGIAALLLVTSIGLAWKPSPPPHRIANSIAVEYGVGVTAKVPGKGVTATSYTLAACWQLNGAGEQYTVNPFDVTADADGNVFVIDYGHTDGINTGPCVRKFDAHGHFLAKWGTGGSGEGEFHFPCGIDTDADGDVYVADQDNYRVQKFDNSGRFLMQIAPSRSDPGSLSPPTRTVIAPDGNIYICSMGGYIKKFTADGKFLFAWGSQGQGDGQFLAPDMLGRDPAGNIFVLDIKRADVQKFTADGKFLRKWPVKNPWGLDVDSAGNVYVGSRDRNSVMKFTNDGHLITEIPAVGPQTVKVDHRGYVYTISVSGGPKEMQGLHLLIYRPK